MESEYDDEGETGGEMQIEELSLQVGKKEGKKEDKRGRGGS